MTVAETADSPRLRDFLAAAQPEDVFIAQLRDLIAARRHRPRPPPARGRPLRFLLVGYSGGGNTGADVRVGEIIRQIDTMFGREQVELGLTLVGDAVPDAIFAGAAQERIAHYVVDFLDRTEPDYDGMLACEGSMFKSKNSDVFSGMMAGALGMADAGGKLAVGYGADAGPMTARLERFVRDLGRGPLMLCRAAQSAALLSDLGLRTAQGADTAWTFDPGPPDAARARLRALGWDGAAPLLIVCPINPFWWPVIASPAMAAEMAETGAHRDRHYGSVFFHSASEARRTGYARYLDGLAQAAAAWRGRTGGMVLIVGMERLDRPACDDLAGLLAFPAPRLVSGEAPVAEIVGVLRQASLLISSRYHAIVTAMPGLVPAIGVSMDERIDNLLAGDARLLKVDDPNLGDALVAAMAQVTAQRDAVIERTGLAVVGQLRALGRMSRDFAAEACRVHPALTPRVCGEGWADWLPPPSPALRALVERYA
jgi:polysaccharide pyruvyl transferase WcaK-like protein